MIMVMIKELILQVVSMGDNVERGRRAVNMDDDLLIGLDFERRSESWPCEREI